MTCTNTPQLFRYRRKRRMPPVFSSSLQTNRLIYSLLKNGVSSSQIMAAIRSMPRHRLTHNPITLQLHISFQPIITRNLSKEITKHYPMMLKHALALARDNDLAKDIVQEACRKALEANSKKPFQPKGDYDNNLSAWLCRIVHNAFITYTRSQSYREVLNIEKAEYTMQQEDIIPSYMQQEIRSAINTLPPTQRSIMELTLQDFNCVEIAEQLKIAVNSVKLLKKMSERELKRRFTKNDCL